MLHTIAIRLMMQKHLQVYWNTTQIASSEVN